MSTDYLVALEAEDGTWYDEPEVVVGLNKARAVAAAQTLPRGYDAVLYELRFLETVRTNTDAVRDCALAEPTSEASPQ